MQLYVLDRAKNTLATTSDYYNDKHTKTLEAGSSSYEFTIDKTDEAAQQMVSGNYIITQDDQGRNWAFAILDYDETHLTKTVYCEDVGIELINKAMDIWPNTGTHPFEYYFDLVTKDTPWKLGINQLSGLSRTLTYTGQDTGLGRLLSILTGFDHAECIFNVQFTMNAPVEFTIDVYKQIGTVQSNIQIVYNNELDDIKKTESRAEFVTALKGVGGTIEPEVSDDGTTTTTTTDTQETVDFSDLEYDDGDYYTVKGDPFLRARTANKKFNSGDNGWIENFYSYDTQDPKELLNRTITRLKTYSEPQYTYEAEVKVIDATLDIGDTVTIIDHDYNPALYLQARVATLEKSYTDPTKNTMTFTNYQLLNSSLTGRIKDLQNIINGMPTSSQITAINANLVKLVAANNQLKQQLEVVITSADGTTNNYYGETKPSDAKEGDTWYKTVDGKVAEIDTYVNGEWVPITLTTDQVKNMVDDATKGIPQMETDIATAVSTAQDAADKFSKVSDTLNDITSLATGAKTDAAKAATDASTALNSAKSAQADATKAITAADGVSDSVSALKETVDSNTATIETLATQKDIDTLKGTVTSLSTETKQTTALLAQKADSTTVDTLKGTVTSQGTLLNQTADKLITKAEKSDVDSLKNTVTSQQTTINQTSDSLKLMATKTDLTTATKGLATESYVGAQIKVSATEIGQTVSAVKTQLDGLSVGGTNLLEDTQELTTSWELWRGDNNGLLDTDSDVRTKVIHLYDTGGSPHGTTYHNLTNVHLEKGQSYTFSAKLKYYSLTPTGATAASTIKLFSDYTTDVLSGAGFVVTTTLTDQYVRYSVTFVAQTTGDYSGWRLIDWEDHYVGGSLFIAEQKLEKGSIATDWSPAIADQATVTALTNISQTVDAIKLLATDNQNNLTSLTVKVNGWQSTVTDQINGVQNQQTSLANQYTSVISNINTSSNRNYVLNSNFASRATSWNWNIEGLTLNYDHSMANYKKPGIHIYGATTTAYQGIFQPITNLKLTKGQAFSFTTLIATDGGGAKTSGLQVIIHYKAADDSIIDQSSILFPQSNDWNSKYTRLTASFSAKVDCDHVQLMLYVEKDKGVNMYLTEIGLTLGTLALGWQPAPDDLATSTQFTQLQNSINLSVKKGDVVTQLNLDAGAALIKSNKIYMDASSTIFSGKAFIPSAAITDLTADKITTGTLNASNVKVINIDGANIVANSITANQLSTQAIQVGLSNWGQDMALQPSGIIMHDGENIVFELNKTGIWVSDGTNGTETGWIHSNHIVAHPEIYGLTFDLAHAAHFMSWGYQDTADGNYGIKMAWYDTPSAKIMNTGQGFQFNNSVHMHAKTVFHGGIYPAGTRDEDESHLNFKTYTINGLRGIGLVNDNGYGLVITDAGGIWLNAGNTAYDLLNMVKNVKW